MPWVFNEHQPYYILRSPQIKTRLENIIYNESTI